MQSNRSFCGPHSYRSTIRNRYRAGSQVPSPDFKLGRPLCRACGIYDFEIPTGKTRDADVLAGFVFGTCGEGAKAETIVSELSKNYPLDTIVQKVSIPQIRARITLQRGDSAKTIEQLRPTEAYQFGYIADGKPVYLRGLGYLHAKQGSQDVTEFQKILDHTAAFGASSYVSMARLGLARGLVLSGDSAKARIAYQDFFTAWKDADPDIPILKQAKAEYTKLN